ncbi:hypothetical protein SO802_022179 [Lithocarpus litseifolius]|uniref:Uncharacterized protein n=1 Tax=Lithocarpus litseifolius TaxID=425828 RepID=A0AAW2CHC7_9ROSI
MEYLEKENMAIVDQKQEKIEDEKKIIMRKKKKKLGGIKTLPFIFGRQMKRPTSTKLLRRWSLRPEWEGAEQWLWELKKKKVKGDI